MIGEKILILGGGISGLAARYFLCRGRPDREVVLVEKENRLGGMIATSCEEGFFFEGGPRTFRGRGNRELLALIDRLDLRGDLLYAKKGSRRRMVWSGGRMHTLPRTVPGLFFSPLGRMLFSALLKERKVPPYLGDETIRSFALRRFGREVADTFFDPLTLGIYGGDPDKRSILSCFPELKEYEKTYGSLLRGFLKAKRGGNSSGVSSLFTLRGGMESLIRRLADRGRGEICCNEEVQKIEVAKGHVVVFTQRKTRVADRLVCALPFRETARLLPLKTPETEAFFRGFSATKFGTDLSVIRLGFNEGGLLPAGFGYLIPSAEKEPLLGAIFDSSIFPEQDGGRRQSRLTVMTRPDPAREVGAIIRTIRKHLRIGADPDYVREATYREAIPPYTPGHARRLRAFSGVVNDRCPHISFIGNYLSGVSVNACITLACITPD
ncbi:MAG: protoporphyrinogen oxidase [Simkaniaceae bacterium]|nr:protoporphyrinogen oxidase [Simkaniaceae bacterium]